MELKVVQVYFNPHESVNDQGIKFINYDTMRVGFTADSLIPEALTRLCVSMRKCRDDDGDTYIEVEFNDGTYDQIFNYSHLIVADNKAYKRIIGEQFNTEENE